jgi:hypothetical protein
MKPLLILFFMIFAAHSKANLHLAPPDFNIPEGRAVFVDFTDSHHQIVFDGKKRRATATSTITFFNTKPGMPIFDLVETPSLVEIDGVAVEQKLISLPGGESEVRIALKRLEPGVHTLKVVNRIKRNVRFSLFRNVKAGFWIRDLKSRMFWEQYLPVNLEYDQHPRTMDIEFKGRKIHNQALYANGKVERTSVNTWRIEYPAWYTVSAPYFHTFRAGSKPTSTFNLTSIDGRQIPITIYTQFPWRVSTFVRDTVKVFHELEADYGPWPNEFFIAYGSGFGGMEHAGATQTSLGALDHEMLHCYFAKGVLPANGNTGWIDEAIARWRDDGYPTRYAPGVPANLAGRSIYARNTNSQAYAHGSHFLSYLDSMMQNVGGMKAFLRGYFQAYKYTLVTTDHFINNLEFFTGMSLRQMFQDNVFTATPEKSLEMHGDHAHPEMTDEMLEALL